MTTDLKYYKNIHKDKDIYVIGSGSSCDFIDNSFFDNKITIGINQVYKKYKTQYLVRKELKLISNIIKNIGNTILFISSGNCGVNNNENYNYINKEFKNCKNIIIYNHNDIATTKGCINLNILENLTEDKLIASHSTITSGIYLAAYMGAKTIILVGHDCGTIDGQSNFKNYHTKESRQQDSIDKYNSWLRKIEDDTIILKQFLKDKYKCNVYSLNPFVSLRLEGHIFKP